MTEVYDSIEVMTEICGTTTCMLKVCGATKFKYLCGKGYVKVYLMVKYIT